MKIPTVDEVVAAAKTLESLSRIYEYADPLLGEWSASDIYAEVPHIEAYTKDEKLYADIADHIVGLVFKLRHGTRGDCLKEVVDVLRRYEIRPKD